MKGPIRRGRLTIGPKLKSRKSGRVKGKMPDFTHGIHLLEIFKITYIRIEV